MEVEKRLSVEDLMKPRIIIEKDYPNSSFKIGEIIYNPSAQQSIWANSYPHIFKWLEWWQERKESDMPEYVKISEWPHKGEFIYVHVNKKDAWHEFNAGGYFGIKYKTGGGTYIGSGEPHFIPAPESEYLTLNK